MDASAPSAAPAAGLVAPPGLLRFLTCGSVDDGKSTLIGRLLHDLGLIPDDQMEALEQDSRALSGAAGAFDLALLLDGLESEQEQGITIDVAYRFFRSPRRGFIVADAPGHEQYTRNMATGASASDLAVVVVDARKGVLTQTRRHSFILSLFGVRHIVLAVNKCDLVDYAEAPFRRISDDYERFTAPFSFRSVRAVPVSALHGDNVVNASRNMPWYEGPTLLDLIETIDIEQDRRAGPFRMAVQHVCRPNAAFRGFAGTISAGVLRLDDPVTVAGSGRATRVARIVGPDGDRTSAAADDAVMLLLADEVDVSRGDVLCSPHAPPEVVDQFAAHLLWVGADPMAPGRSYLMKLGTRTLPCTVTELKHRIEVNTGGHEAAKTLAANQIGFCNLALPTSVPIDPYAENRHTGGFILIDRFSSATVGAGMVAFALRRARNLRPEALSVAKAERAAIKHQKPAVLWFTGLSGAGKTTIANAVERKLHAGGCHTYLIDGDNVRGGLNRDLGFSEADRVENVRRVAEVARLFTEAGLIVLVSLISPFRAERLMARELMPEGEFVEIFVDTPLNVCRQRDPKGLYAKAARGELINFTGVDSPYQPPDDPELRLKTTEADADRLAEAVITYLAAQGIVEG